ncbi:MAG TPA: aspartate aminotransferase [Flavobacteriales bacterium]|nr:aspartate aminotransferase [Flavobacteriales bacterium]HCA83240.1 aspartate aminotransferase [Flavobacteriales bacterium]HRE74048.1 pyridoxal phosphate-dependent aminotransferase [Flavobacteriales bacterium]HRE95911.1 pyridoxal phosphate-dependent aminotransferase [Flavobacteriales bacterium]HRJ34422.1 pyridoxal phosphate-dependent aminotransferase [Flavobacteriales bacterium]
MNLLSARITNLTESATLAMARKSRELTAKGLDIINLSLGEPDFATPEFIKDAAKAALDANFTKYTPVNGYQDLRDAIALKFKRDNGIDYTADQIVVSTGAKQSIANVVMSLVDPGDEVIIPTPFWVSYEEMVKLAEGKCVFIRAGIETDFKITAEQLEKAITPATKLMIFSTPCNPTGSVYSKKELEGIAAVMERHPRLFVIADEIYEHINFHGKHESLATFASIRDRVITVNGVSKGYAMTGWRIGFIGASKEIADACTKMQGQITSGTCSIAQKAAKAAMLEDPKVTIPMREAFLKRRDLILRLVAEIPGMKCNVPQGAFYIFPEVTDYFGKSHAGFKVQTAGDLCLYLLEHAQVAVVTGEAFGEPRCIRISYATSEDVITEAMRRIKTALAQLS